MAERVQLQEPGTELTLTVNKVEVETIQNTEYYLFANGEKELLVPKSSVTSQIDRLGVTNAAHLLGKTVRFSRSTKLSRYGKPFWNLDLSSGAESGGTSAAPAPTGVSTGSVSQPVAAESSDDRDKALLAQRAIFANRMKQAVAYTLENILPLYAKAEIGLTGDEVYKHSFSIYKSWEEAGLIR